MNVGNSAITEYVPLEKSSKAKISPNFKGEQFNGFLEIAVVHVIIQPSRKYHTIAVLNSNILNNHTVQYGTGVVVTNPSPLWTFVVDSENTRYQFFDIPVTNPFFICKHNVSSVEFQLLDVITQKVLDIPFIVHFVFRQIQ